MHARRQSATSCGVADNILWSQCGGANDTYPQMTIYVRAPYPQMTIYVRAPYDDTYPQMTIYVRAPYPQMTIYVRAPYDDTYPQMTIYVRAPYDIREPSACLPPPRAHFDAAAPRAGGRCRQ